MKNLLKCTSMMARLAKRRTRCRSARRGDKWLVSQFGQVQRSSRLNRGSELNYGSTRHLQEIIILFTEHFISVVCIHICMHSCFQVSAVQADNLKCHGYPKKVVHH
jgi:hypothetical protein